MGAHERGDSTRDSRPRKTRVLLVIDELCPQCSYPAVRAAIRWTASQLGPPWIKFFCVNNHEWYSKRQPTVEEIQEEDEEE